MLKRLPCAMSMSLPTYPVHVGVTTRTQRAFCFPPPVAGLCVQMLAAPLNAARNRRALTVHITDDHGGVSPFIHRQCGTESSSREVRMHRCAKRFLLSCARSCHGVNTSHKLNTLHTAWLVSSHLATCLPTLWVTRRLLLGSLCRQRRARIDSRYAK